MKAPSLLPKWLSACLN